MIADLEIWPEDELKAAAAFLDGTKEAEDLGNLDDCPDWVRFCGQRYISDLLKGDTPKVRPMPIFTAKTDYERKQRHRILAARADLWERQDWLKGDPHPALADRFGSVGGVPDWLRTAAVRDLQQQIFNLSTGQRRNPAERNPI